MQENPANFNFSWNSYENYWLCIVPGEVENLPTLQKDLEHNGLTSLDIDGTCLAVISPKDWAESWQQIYLTITKNNIINPKVAVIQADSHRPSLDTIMGNLDSVENVNAISKNMWLADALSQNRLKCHFQTIIDRKGQAFGYEAFARIRQENNELVSGAKIIQAARDLNIEHALDKRLHQLAVKTFAEAHLDGCLFINFMAGFIQLPQKYLEGLSDMVKEYDILAKRIVLDVADAENVRDLNQITSIINYCNSKGYSIALDDINSLKSLTDITYILSAKPDYIKLDKKIVHESSKNKIHKEIMKITELAHSQGSMVLAEGVEDANSQKSLMDCSVDLFQGYHISQPLPVSDIIASKTKVAS